MSFEKVHKAVAERITARQNTFGATVIASNQGAQPPTAEPWIRWALRPAGAFNSDVNAQYERSSGIIYFQIFVPEGKGERAAFTIRDKIGAAFNEARFTTDDNGLIRCERVSLDYIGSDSAGWQQFNATVRYLEDELALNAS